MFVNTSDFFWDHMIQLVVQFTQVFHLFTELGFEKALLSPESRRSRFLALKNIYRDQTK